jgi:hypothetical protein
MSPRCSPTAISLLVLQMGRSSLRRCSMGVPDSALRTTYQMNRCSSATPSCPADRLPEDMVTLPLRIVSDSAFRHRRAASGPAASLLPPPGSFSNLWSQCCVVLFSVYRVLSPMVHFLPHSYSSMIVFCLFHGLVSSAEYVFYFLFSSVFLSCPSLGREL